MLGEHTAEVLGELGMNKVEIDTLASIGAVKTWHAKDSS
jgi:crotonobetainyl-CoA:carnitine CoA-transferase CaiB-like acyl-CoA transferase